MRRLLGADEESCNMKRRSWQADKKGPVFPLDAAAKIKPREEVSCCEKMSQGSNFFRIIVLFDLEVGTVVTASSILGEERTGKKARRL